MKQILKLHLSFHFVFPVSFFAAKAKGSNITPFVLSYKSLLPSILSTIFPFRSKAKIGLFRLLSNQTNKPVFRLVETFYELDVEIYVLYPFCKTEPLFGFFNFHRNARFLPLYNPLQETFDSMRFILSRNPPSSLSAIYQASGPEPLNSLKTLHEKSPAHEARGIKMKGRKITLLSDYR